MTRHGRAVGRPEPPPLPARQRGVVAVSRSFARDAAVRQGVYETGGQPTVYDPLFTQQRVPEAVLRHEEVHQSLALQTFHGVLTLILSRYVRVAAADASLAACEATQWYVQEAGATYAELAYTQRDAPLDFAAAVAALPSAATGGEPYREAFDLVNWLLPLDAAAPTERNDPRTFVVGALCSCSMATSCLRELATADFDDGQCAAWIANNSPDARFERIGRAVGPGVFRQLAKTAADRVSKGTPTQRSVQELFSELSSEMLAHVPGVTAEPLSQLRAQAKAAVRRLRKGCPAFVFDVDEALHPRGPMFTESPEKKALLRRQFKFDDLDTGN